MLEALLWCFLNSRSGACFPSYEAIAEKAGCARSTVAEALKALEFAHVLTWQNRLENRKECHSENLRWRFTCRWATLQNCERHRMDPATLTLMTIRAREPTAALRALRKRAA